MEKYIPLTKSEMKKRNWTSIDILLITGDAYVDHPSFGNTIIARVLESEGYKVGIISQPDWNTPESLQVFGRPNLACCITSGNMDSQLNIYTAGRRFRREDAYSENGETGKRPQNAIIVYSQLAKRAFPKLPIIIGGIEASLRRVTHYDYWQDKLKPSVLATSKADILIYGMGERAIKEIISKISQSKSLENIKGTARLLGKKDSENLDITDEYILMPSYEEHLTDKDALLTSTILIEKEMNPYCGRILLQKYGDRLLVVEPPAIPLTTEELDAVHSLPFTGTPHPIYKGKIPAFETIKNSIPAVRGCPGGCAFCGLVSHQGRFVRSRSEESIISEVCKLQKNKFFRGTISDIGGPAGNIYGHSVFDEEQCKKCRRASCLSPKQCANYHPKEEPLIHLLKSVRTMDKVKHLYINSGIRLELALQQKELTKEIIRHHVSGHLKVAPEHLNSEVLSLMRKSSGDSFYEFMEIFKSESDKVDKEQYLIPLFISNFPGCTEKQMQEVDDFLNMQNWSPQQVQDFIPLPMTMGAAMYYSGKDFNYNEIKVNRGLKERRPQIEVLKKKRRNRRR